MTYDAHTTIDPEDIFSVNTLMKARPVEEDGRRFIFFEASNEGTDQEDEKILAKALEDSAEHFLKFGNIDIDHYTMIGKPNPKKGWVGIPDPEQYEIGNPVDVRVDGKSTFVKAELYKGEGPLAIKANMVWESLTSLNPPARWYPSVGGGVLERAEVFDETLGRNIQVVTKVRWTNVGLSRTPVNQHIPTAQTAPLAVFVKSLNGYVFNKALEAGYGTDVSQLTGGAALGMQSIDTSPSSYYDFREKLSGGIRSREAKLESLDSLISYTSEKFQLPRDEAAEWVDRYLRDIKRKLN